MKEISRFPLVMVVGLPCTGKSTFAHVASRKGFLTYEWSHVFHEYKHLPAKRNARYLFVKNLISASGRSNFLDKILSNLRQQLNRRPNPTGIVVVGARDPLDVRMMTRRFTNHRVVYLVSPLGARMKRNLMRDRKMDSKDICEFVRQDMFELKEGLADLVFHYADSILENNGSIRSFNYRVIDYLSKF